MYGIESGVLKYIYENKLSQNKVLLPTDGAVSAIISAMKCQK